MKIKVTKKAISQLEFMYSDDTKVIRIQINGFGWGGPVFGIVLDEQYDDDYMEEQKGMKFAVNNDILERFSGFNIDYIASFFRKGFVVGADYGTTTC